MPKPNKGESKKDFISRCIPMLIKEGKEQDQAVAVCSSIWEEKDQSKARFTGTLRALSEKELKDIGISKAYMLSEASSLIPESLDAEKNIDVLPVVFNLAVVNQFNANGDCITAIDAAKVVKQFVHKPLNVEHDKTAIVGHIINASFSDKQPDVMENEITDYINRTDPFYITAAAVVYKHVFPDLAEALELASDKDDYMYQAFSASWEIGFSDFHIGVGSKNLEDCVSYTKEDESYSSYVDNLKAFGGSGSSKDGPVGRILKGKMVPLGAAITENPAANVKGVYTIENILNKEKSSTISKSNVNDKNDNYHSDMTDEQFKELTGLLKNLAEAKNLDESNASAFDKIQETLKEAGKEWKSKAEANQEAAEKAQKELEAVKSDLSKATEELDSLKGDLETREKAEQFNARMSTINDKYDLAEAEEKIVVSEVQSLASDDDAFTSYLEKLSVVFAHKDREVLKAQEEKENSEKEEKESKASKEEREEKEIEISESKKSSVSNNNGEESEGKSLIDRLRENGLELVK